MSQQTPYLEARPQCKHRPIPVALNSRNTLVIKQPALYRAVVPVCVELDSPAFPEWQGVPSEQGEIETYNQSVRSAIGTQHRAMRNGYVYVFRKDKLFAEYRVEYDPATRISLFHAIDLIVDQGKDARCADKAHVPPAPYILVPQQGDHQIAYSEGQWPWLRIQALGGLHRHISDSHLYDYPLLCPESGVPEVEQDDQLIEWSAGNAERARRARCQLLPTEQAPKDGKDYPLNGYTQRPDQLIPAEIQAQFPHLSTVTAEPISGDRWVTAFTLMPLQDPLLVGHQIAQNLQLAWDVLDRVMANMKNPELSDYPHARYFDSALLAYQLYYTAPKADAGTTNWQRDQGNAEAFEHLNLGALQDALAIDLRRTVYQTINIWQEQLAHFINGSDNWSGWDSALKAALDDFMAMPESPSPQTEDEHDPQFWGFRYRRWYHLQDLLSLVGKKPEDFGKVLEQDPSASALAQQAQQGPGPQLIRQILMGTHPLSELVLNAPSRATYRFQLPLVELTRHSQSLHNRSLTEADRVHLKEKEMALLNAYWRSAAPAFNLYHPDGLHPVAEAPTDDSAPLAMPVATTDQNIKVALASIKYALPLFGSLNASAVNLSVPIENPQVVHPLIERLRHAMNSATGSHLTYSSFDQLFSSTDNANQRAHLIAEFLYQIRQNHTAIISETPPNEQHRKAKQKLDQDLDDLNKQYWSTRFYTQKRLHDTVYPQQIDDAKTQLKQLQQDLSDAHEVKNQFVIERNRARRYLDILPESAGLIEVGRAQALHLSLNLKVDQQDNKIEALKRGHTQARQRKAHLSEEFKWLKDIFAKTRRIYTDPQSHAGPPQVLAFMDEENPRMSRLLQQDASSPLQELNDQDQAYRAAIEDHQNAYKTSVSAYRNQFEDNQKALEAQGKQIANTATPEGRELSAFWKTQYQKLIDHQDLKIISCNDDADFEQKKSLYGQDPKSIVLTPTESRLWQQQSNGNYILLNQGERLTAADPAHSPQSNLFRQASATLSLYAFDLWNAYLSAAAFTSGGENAHSARNTIDLIGGVLGTSAGGAELWRLVENHKMSASPRVPKISAYERVSGTPIAGTTRLAALETWALRFNIASSACMLMVSVIDGYASFKKDDDVTFAHLTIALGAGIGLWGTASGATLLGPVGLGIIIVGYLFQRFLFREDNILNTWLEHGPFSLSQRIFRSRLRPIPEWQNKRYVSLNADQQLSGDYPLMPTKRLHPWKASSQAFRVDIPNRLTNEEGEKLASLHLSLPSSFAKSGLLILDQNYRVLGIDYTHLHLD
ncbi:MAG: hypothetical protein P8077_00415, partial [Gammaproteobacteria bacterium]